MGTRESGSAPDHVAIYIRWSTDDQSDGTTLAVQLEGCRHYVLSQGWTLRDDLIFIDDGWSGGSLDRPALSRLRRLVREGQVDCVVVLKLDRLSRSVGDMVNLVLNEWDGLTHVRSAREPLDTATAMGRQFFYMLVSFAEWERSVIRERTAAGRRARAREGYKPSAIAPFGYRHGERTGSYAVEETEAPIVRRIFGWYARGLGARSIVCALNAEGIRFRGGAMWNERTVLYLLSNPVYTGKAVYGRLSRNPRRDRAGGGPFWLRNDDPTVVPHSPYIPALVDDSLFARAQQVKAQRRRGGISGRAVASGHLVTGLARCRCGYSLYVKSTRNQKGQEFSYYACLGKKLKGPNWCRAGNIPRQVLERRVEQEILTRYAACLTTERLQLAAAQGMEQATAELAGALAGISRQLEALEAEERRIRTEFRSGAISGNDFQTLRQDLNRERGEALALQQGLGARLASQPGCLPPEAGAALHRWDVLSPQQQKSLLGSLVAAMTAYGEPDGAGATLDIEWRERNAWPATNSGVVAGQAVGVKANAARSGAPASRGDKADQGFRA